MKSNRSPETPIPASQDSQLHGLDVFSDLTSGPYDIRLINSVRAACDIWLAKRGLIRPWKGQNFQIKP